MAPPNLLEKVSSDTGTTGALKNDIVHFQGMFSRHAHLPILFHLTTVVFHLVMSYFTFPSDFN